MINKLKIVYSFLLALFSMSLILSVGIVSAHDIGATAGAPVCLEGNYMMADAMNAPFAS